MAAPTKHTQQVAALARLGAPPGRVTKNLFLRDKKRRAFLVTALDDTPVDLKALSRRLGVGSGNLSWGAPALLASTLGVAPGCVTALAVANRRAAARCALLLDARLRGAGHFFVHPIVNGASVRMTAEGLDAFLRCVCGWMVNAILCAFACCRGCLTVMRLSQNVSFQLPSPLAAVAPRM